jgi:hypothetical protein
VGRGRSLSTDIAPFYEAILGHTRFRSAQNDACNFMQVADVFARRRQAANDA